MLFSSKNGSIGRSKTPQKNSNVQASHTPNKNPKR